MGTLGGAPPAWVESASDSRWLSYGSNCWAAGGKAACVDYLPPERRTDLAEISVRGGASVRLHFAFAPKKVQLEPVAAKRAATLRPARVVTWRPARSMRFVVVALTEGGSATYVGAVRVT